MFSDTMGLLTCGCLNVKIHVKSTDLKQVDSASIGKFIFEPIYFIISLLINFTTRKILALNRAMPFKK